MLLQKFRLGETYFAGVANQEDDVKYCAQRQIFLVASAGDREVLGAAAAGIGEYNRSIHGTFLFRRKNQVDGATAPGGESRRAVVGFVKSEIAVSSVSRDVNFVNEVKR